MEIDVQTTRQSVRPLHGLWKAGEAPRAAKPAMCAKTRETVPPWRGWPNTAEPRGGHDPHARKQWFKAAIGGKSSADVVQMWCTAPLDAPRGADFSPSHGRDLDFLWSGRRDSNPRPSPWQGDLAQLCHQPLHTFSNVLLGF